jgi:2-dehydropantoate 2-reductase
MNICVFGAGAIGSLFAGILSKNNQVNCVARKPHVHEVNKHGLMITGKTQLHKNIPFFETIDQINEIPELIIITVKSYDTEQAAKKIATAISDKTIILSLQNGLDNIEKITKHISKKQVLAGITSHGSLFIQSGIIKHTGYGKTRIGELNSNLSDRLRLLQTMFIKAGISTEISSNIKKEIWKKAIVNASINSLTAIFQCNNGYLLTNPILSELVNKICTESTIIANANGFNINQEDMLEYTKEVIDNTKMNISSMFQSIRQKKKTEIHAINGAIKKYGNKKKCDVQLNEVITNIVTMMYD